MQPWQQCDGGYPIGVWMSVLLIFIVVIGWKHWSRMGWAGRVGVVAAFILVLGGSIVTGYWQDQARSTGGTCGTCVMPALSSPAAGPSTRPVTVTTTAASQPGGDSSLVTTSPEAVAFYFHRTIRCHSCLQIEEWAKQAIETRFAGQIAAGMLEWRPINIEEPGNEHFEKDYELTAQSLVLVRMKDGQPADWKNLKSVWELLDDYARFTEYVQSEVEFFLGGASGT
jgi:hypothetical protein